MIYLKKGLDGVVKFDLYFDYIESLRNLMPERSFKFASNWDHYSLESKSSLHDCWLESIVVDESGKGERKENRNVTVSISFLGSYHDRLIRLVYHGVASYVLTSSKLADTSRGHGDLVMHEFRMNDDGYIEHELVFSDQSRLLISFSDLIHTESAIDE